MADQEKHTDRSIYLWDGAPPGSAEGNGFRPWLEPYPVETRRKHGAVIVFPGGGYGFRAPHEGTPIAERFNEIGVHGFVCQYRVDPNRHPAPLQDAARAVRIVRSRAREWNVDPDRIAVCGFSAGGHLAASVGVHYDKDDAKGGDDLDSVSARPDAMILAYPVISAGVSGHQGSFTNLLSDDATEELRRRMSLEHQVDERTPPAFIWHTAVDDMVPVENSILFALMHRKHGIPFELHIYSEGNHGLGLAPKVPHVATWSALCCEWLQGMKW